MALAKGQPASDEDRAGPAGDYPMVLGAPFVVDGVTYTPADTMNYDAVGYAGQDDGAGISGAHRTLPLPSYVEVTALDSGKTILVRLERRGPMIGKKLVDLSPAAWAQLGLAPGSQAPVRVRRVNPIEPERALLRQGERAPARMDTPPGLLTALRRKLGTATGVTLAPAGTPAPAATPHPVLPSVAPPKPAASPTPKPTPRPAPSAPVTAATPAPKPAPVAKPSPHPVVAPAPTPRPVPTATPSPKPTPKPSPKPAPAAARQTAGLYVQVGAFSTRPRAETVAKAVGGGVTAVGSLWRVRSGPFVTQAEADAALAKARRSGYADARILRAP
ncbi:sporulation protein [Novosphingobium sp. EMRT-2]|nr:sporulation protein [Novosphingobium sp. EMRT-2]